MKKILLIAGFISVSSFAQNPEKAQEKVIEGIYLHDNQKYNEALSKYDEALKLDENNIFALAEKAVTFETLKKYSEAIEICKNIIKLYPKNDLRTVYLSYGNSLDNNNQSKKAINIYNEGLKKYPDFYQLYYNKGIALVKLNKIEEGIESFETATKLYPNHSSSYYVLSILETQNRIANILVSGRYLVLDNKSANAKKIIHNIDEKIYQGISKDGDNTLNITLDDSFFRNTKSQKKMTNDFSDVELILSLNSASYLLENNKDKTNIQKFVNNFKIIFNGLEEGLKNNKGYYWEFLAPYYIEMNKKDLVEPFVNYILLANNDEEAIKYSQQNSDKIEEFMLWNTYYPWDFNVN